MYRNTANPKRLLCSSITLTGSLLAMSAAAQQPQLEEVVVTAQKRSENLQETPISITALTSGSIEKRGISNVENLIGTIPAVAGFEAPSGRGNVSVAIRGVSSGSPNNPSVDPANAFYMDGVYVGKMTGSALDVADIERIEVLRGPQGTLYGRNSTGGAVNFITKKPLGEFAAKITASAGNYDLWGLKGLIDTPAIGTEGEGVGTLAAQFGYYTNNRDELYGNTNRAQDGFENIDREAWRGAVTWQLRDNVTVDYSYDSSDLDENSQLQNLIGVTPLSADGSVGRLDTLRSIQPFARFVVPGQFAERYAQSLDLTIATLEQAVAEGKGRPNKGSSDRPTFSKTESEGHALTLAWDADDLGVLGEVTFKSITGYREVKNQNAGDLDGVDNTLDPVTGIGRINDATLLQLANPAVSDQIKANIFFAIDQIGAGYAQQDANTEYDQLSQELQMVGTSGRLDYALGLFYFEDDVKFETLRGFALPLAGLDRPRYENETEAKGIYSQVTFTPPGLEERLSIDVGLRYTEETKSVEYNYTRAFSPFDPRFDPSEPNGPDGPNSATELLPEQPPTFPVDKFGRSGSADFDNISGMVNFKYQWTDTLMTYLKYSTGYRSGGYNGETISVALGDPNSGEPLPYAEETIKSLEFGYKSDWWNSRLRLNGALFGYKYDDQQVSQIIVEPSGATSSNIVNAGVAERWGFELEATIVPLESVELSFNWAHLAGDFEEYAQLCAGTTEASCLANPENKALRPNGPDNQLSLVLDWTILQTDFASVNAHIGTYWIGKTAGSALWSGTYDAGTPDATVVAYDAIYIDERTLVNARLGLEDIAVGQGTLRFALWGKNLLDDDYASFGVNFATLGPITEQYGEPRTYGLDITYEF